MASQPPPRRSFRARLAGAFVRFVSIGDVPGDDDDTLLRKRVGVVAGYVTVIVPYGVVLGSPEQPVVGWAAALGLSLWSAGNLLVLARTKRFERFVVALIAVGAPFTFLATILVGGVLNGSGSLVWAFLVPAYAILALGPRRATPWFFVFLATLVLAVAVDPIVSTWFQPPPYATQLIFYVQSVGLPLTIVFLLLRYVDVRRRAAEARSEELLTNAIPASIAYRLRHGESRIAEAYPDTTIVFTDIAGFTPWASRTDPARVVALLDDLFSRFDRLVAEHGLEKIKTVGDAYMASAGVPQARADHAQAAVRFARASLGAVSDWRRENGLELEARVGLASGVVVGGVIGQRRITFDLWGDTVNTAARMESSGVPGRIHVAASTRALLDDSFGFEERQLEVKGLGQMTTYLVVLR
ncbi:MAG TPA: adenylate/guanylate cyclase domain-containing protein [Candidatus Acidoferrales bacterium]|nr:adenylate/guanylate cyclase domain-containing protein [Candidatus Acidoferrales bacterium]